MTTVELRPMSLGELLDRTFTVYRNHFWLFVGIMALPAVVTVPMGLWSAHLQGAPLPIHSKPDPTLMAKIWVASLLFWPVYWVIYSVALGATTNAVSEIYMGRTTTIRRAYAGIRGRFWRLMNVVFSVGIRIFGTLLLIMVGVAMIVGGAAAGARSSGPSALVIVGFVMVAVFAAALILTAWLMLRYGVAIPAMLIENQKARLAIERSVQLTRGYRWQIFLAGLLMTVVAYAAVLLFQGPFLVTTMVAAQKGPTPFWFNFLTAIFGAVGGAISRPLLMIVLVLFYYDLRVRKEAFDLQHMMASLDGGEAAPTASPV